MILLENSIHKLKCDFNQKVSELKERKRQIIDRVTDLNSRLKVINEELGVEEEQFVPVIHEELEYPERYFNLKGEEMAEFKRRK